MESAWDALGISELGVKGASGIPWPVHTFLSQKEAEGKRCDDRLTGGQLGKLTYLGMAVPGVRSVARPWSCELEVAGVMRGVVGEGGGGGSGPAANCTFVETKILWVA